MLFSMRNLVDFSRLMQSLDPAGRYLAAVATAPGIHALELFV